MRVAGLSVGQTPDRTSAVDTAGRWSRRVGFQRLLEAFQAAAARTGIVERVFSVGGGEVVASFAGSAMVPAIEPALEHLSAAKRSGRVDLNVHIWDSASTGVHVPEQPNGADSAADGDPMDRIRSSFQTEAQILTLYDSDSREAVVWVPDAERVPSNEVASPMRTLLHWWARDRGFQFVHAGAVSHAGMAVLLAGPSGAGKSTATLAALLYGLDYLGDDYVLVDAGGGRTIHSLFSAAKLHPGQMAAFPELLGTVANADRLGSEKALWFMHRDYPERTVTSAEAVAVLVPQISGGATSSVTPIPRSTALAALAPSTIVQLSGADQWSLDAMASFLSRVSAYRLEAGRDLHDLAAVIRTAIEHQA